MKRGSAFAQGYGGQGGNKNIPKPTFRLFLVKKSFSPFPGSLSFLKLDFFGALVLHTADDGGAGEDGLDTVFDGGQGIGGGDGKEF